MGRAPGCPPSPPSLPSPQSKAKQIKAKWAQPGLSSHSPSVCPPMPLRPVCPPMLCLALASFAQLCLALHSFAQLCLALLSFAQLCLALLSFAQPCLALALHSKAQQSNAKQSKENKGEKEGEYCLDTYKLIFNFANCKQKRLLLLSLLLLYGCLRGSSFSFLPSSLSLSLCFALHCFALLCFIPVRLQIEVDEARCPTL